MNATVTFPMSTATGNSILILVRNQLPQNGTCSVDKTNGTAMETFFTVTCQNWVDPDGQIMFYQYSGKLIHECSEFLSG